MPGRKSLGCPVGELAAVGAIWETTKRRGLNITKFLQPRKLTRGKVAFADKNGKPTHSVLGKADDIEEETGKSTRWDRRGRGQGIWGQICRDRVGKMPLAAGAGSNLARLLERGEEPKEGVTCHIVPPDAVRVFSGWFLGFFFGLTGGRWRRSAREWDRILARVGTTGIPAAEERKTGIWSARQKRPGGLRVLSPRPPLRDFTKEMACFLALYDG